MRSMRLIASLAICALMVPAAFAITGSGPSRSVGEGTPTLRDPIINQFDACTGSGAANQQFPDFGDAVIAAADDFSLTEEVTLGQAIALGSFDSADGLGPYNSISVDIYNADGAGGFPGSIACTESGLQSAGGDTNDPDFDVTLDESCVLAAGDYWAHIYPNMDFGAGGVPGQWFQNSNDSANGSEYVWQDPAGLTGNPCTSWGLGVTTCGIGTTFTDLCFGLGGPGGGDGGDGGGVPAVGTTGVIVMLVLFMGFSVYFLRRRQTA